MSKVMRRGLHLLIISAITVIFGVLTVFGVSAEVDDTFTVNTIEGAPITYKVTSEGEFPEVEVVECPKNYNGTVTLPESVIDPYNNLEYSVTSIGYEAFKYCRSLESITIPTNLTNIGILAFEKCIHLTSITIPESVTSIGHFAFLGCKSLTSITIPDSVTSIGDSVFQDCTSLTSVTIPDSVTSIGNNAFAYCTSLTSITIPESVTSIGRFAFYSCGSLTSITIPNSVTSIGRLAFFGCYSLISIEIPDSVTSIGDEAFEYCTNLSEVYCRGLKPPSLGNSAFNACASDLKIYIPEGTKDAYIAAGWPEDNLIFNTFTITFTINTVEGAPITYQVTSEGAFPEVEVADCQQAYKGAVTLPESVINPYNNLEYSVTSIGDYAFYGCRNLKSVTLGDSITSIGNNAFYACKSLTSVEIPASVTSIGDQAFASCESLSKVYCDGLEPSSLGNGAFTRCASNLEIYIPFGTKEAYVAAGWPKDNLVEIVRSVKVVTKDGALIVGAEVTIYLKEYTPFALARGYTNDFNHYGIYTCPVDIPCDTVEVKKSGFKQVETRVSDNFELVVVMEKI